MSLYEYQYARQLTDNDTPFYALIMAAMRGADTYNLEKLKRLFPDTWEELQARYNAPGGRLVKDGGEN